MLMSCVNLKHWLHQCHQCSQLCMFAQIAFVLTYCCHMVSNVMIAVGGDADYVRTLSQVKLNEFAKIAADQKSSFIRRSLVNAHLHISCEYIFRYTFAISKRYKFIC